MFGTAYFKGARSPGEKEGYDSVNEIVDLGVLERILQEASEDDVKVFRKWFTALMGGGDSAKYSIDLKVELRAMLWIVSLAFMNVEDIGGNEDLELIPFLSAITDKVEYTESIHCFAVILIRLSESDVRVSVSQKTGDWRFCLSLGAAFRQMGPFVLTRVFEFGPISGCSGDGDLCQVG